MGKMNQLHSEAVTDLLSYSTGIEHERERIITEIDRLLNQKDEETDVLFGCTGLHMAKAIVLNTLFDMGRPDVGYRIVSTDD